MVPVLKSFTYLGKNVILLDGADKMSEKTRTIILGIVMLCPFVFYVWYLANKEVWLIYATFVSLGVGFVVLIILTVVLINRRRELTLLNNLENFQNHQKIKIDDNYFCPNCKKMVSKEDMICPHCKNKFH